MSVEDRNGHRYVLVVMDVHSHYVMVVLMKRKSEAAGQLKIIIAREQTQKEKRLKVLHSDGGTEIVNEDVLSFLREHGSVHTHTVAYTPQHNICERMNRTVLEMARALMIHACAHVTLWGDAVRTAAYLINRITSTTTPGCSTPLQAYAHHTHDVSKLHVFGCDVYYYKHKHEREHKFDETASAAIFIGYDSHNDSYYRILETTSGKEMRVSDVRFADNAFGEMRKYCAAIHIAESGGSSERFANENDYLDIDRLTGSTLYSPLSHPSRTVPLLTCVKAVMRKQLSFDTPTAYY
jgi:hypothetical protein